MSNEAELLPGTLDLLILKAVSLGPVHGYGGSSAHWTSNRGVPPENGTNRTRLPATAPQ